MLRTPARLRWPGVGNLSAQARDLLHVAAVTVTLGSPLVTLLALIGLVAGPHSRRCAREDMLFAVAVVALATLGAIRFWQFRFVTPLFVALIPFIARGIDVVAVSVARSTRAHLVPQLALPAAAGRRRVAATAIGIASISGLSALGLMLHVGNAANTFGSPRAAKAAGQWIASHRPSRPITVMSIGTATPYWAGAEWLPLGCSRKPEVILRYIDDRRPDFLTLIDERPAAQPYLAEWVRAGFPDPHYELTATTGTEGTLTRVYRRLPA